MKFIVGFVRFSVVALSMFFLVGWFSYNNVKYNSEEEALTAQRNYHDSLLAQIKPRLSPSYGSALVIVPSNRAFKSRMIKVESAMSEEYLNYLVVMYLRSYQYMTDELGKWNLFERVSFEQAEFPETVALQKIKEYTAIIYLRVRSPNHANWFVLVKGLKGGVPLHIDKSLAVGEPLVMSWLQNIDKIMVRNVNPATVLKATQPAPKTQIQTPEVQSSVTKQVEGEGNEELKRWEEKKALGLMSQEEFDKVKARLKGGK